MNNERRKTLSQAIALLEQANKLISRVLDEEQDAFDNMPEGLQMSERGEQIEENIDTLSNITDELDTFATDLGAM